MDNQDTDTTTDKRSKDDNYEAMVQRLAFAAINEQRRSRRWRIFFLLLTFLYLTPLVLVLVDFKDLELVYQDKEESSKHTAVVRLSGMIMDGAEAGAENVIAGLQDAFEDEDTAGIVLEINSPGGTPVEAAYIYDEIGRLREEHEDIPLHVVIKDIAASGGYYVAAAADKIYANEASLIGSIGVRMGSFGVVDLMEKMGVERRVLTAGEHKALLDPFLPEDAEEKAHLQVMLDQVHQQFIEAVKQGRGDRLQDEPELFTGLVWSGEEALKLGLVDGFASTDKVAREIFEEEDVVDFTPRELLLDRLANRVGAGFARIMQQNLSGGMQLN